MALVLLLITIFYSNYLANKLEENEEKNSSIYFEALNEYSKNLDLQANFELPAAIVDSFALPVIFQDAVFLSGANWW